MVIKVLRLLTRFVTYEAITNAATFISNNAFIDNHSNLKRVVVSCAYEGFVRWKGRLQNIGRD